MLRGCKTAYSSCYQAERLHISHVTRLQGCLFLMLPGCKAAYSHVTRLQGCIFLMLPGSSFIFPILQGYQAAYFPCFKAAKLHIHPVTRLKGCIFLILSGCKTAYSPGYKVTRLQVCILPMIQRFSVPDSPVLVRPHIYHATWQNHIPQLSCYMFPM
jgi:hypothetical protein